VLKYCWRALLRCSYRRRAVPAPDLVRGDMGTTWMCIAGPIIGAMIAVGFEWILKGKPTAAGTSAAQGSLEKI